jgi:hypothetical protein
VGQTAISINSLIIWMRKDNVTPNKNKDSTPYSIFMLYFGSPFCFAGGGHELKLPTILTLPRHAKP